MEVFENKSFNRLNFDSLTREGFDTHIRLCLYFFFFICGGKVAEFGTRTWKSWWHVDFYSNIIFFLIIIFRSMKSSSKKRSRSNKISKKKKIIDNEYIINSAYIIPLKYHLWIFFFLILLILFQGITHYHVFIQIFHPN